jgi:hypothetical protein
MVPSELYFSSVLVTWYNLNFVHLCTHTPVEWEEIMHDDDTAANYALGMPGFAHAQLREARSMTCVTICAERKFSGSVTTSVSSEQ